MGVTAQTEAGHLESSYAYPKPDLGPAPPDRVEVAATQGQSEIQPKPASFPPAQGAPCKNKQPLSPALLGWSGAQGPRAISCRRKRSAHTSARGFLALCAPLPHTAPIIVWKQKASAAETIAHPTAFRKPPRRFFFLLLGEAKRNVYLPYLRKETYGKRYAVFSTVLLSYNYNALHKAKSFRKSVDLTTRQSLPEGTFIFFPNSASLHELNVCVRKTRRTPKRPMALAGSSLHKAKLFSQSSKPKARFFWTSKEEHSRAFPLPNC